MRLGDLDIRVVSGGPFKLDGGGMFGIIPRALWARVAPPDERGRIQLDTNCLLIRGGDEVVLIDTGNGPKLNDKERDIYDLAPGEELLANLAAEGVRPEDVTTVLLSHLHMDHVGGATRQEGDLVVPAFPNARFVVQRREWEDALHNRSHMRTSYRLDNLQALQASDRLDLLDGDAQVTQEISVRVTGGHTPGHHVVFIRSGGETALFAADVCPTVHHLRGPYTMAYDLDPLTSIQVKRDLLAEAAAEGWTFFFDHEPVQKAVRLMREGDHFHAQDVDWASHSAP